MSRIDTKTQVLEIGALLIVGSIPISQFLSVRILFLLLIVSLIIRRVKYSNLFKQSWDILLFLLILGLGIIYSEDKISALRVLETNFSFLAIPIVFNVIKPAKRNLYSLLISFISGVLIASMICIGFAIYRYTKSLDSSFFLFETLMDIVGIQPTYFAYYLCFSLTLSLYFLYYRELAVSKYILTLVSIFLFIILMLTAGRTAYISMLLVFAFFILKFLFEESRSIEKRQVFILSVTFLVSMLFINSLNLNVDASHINESTDYWERIELWKAALNSSKNWFFGVGTGDFDQLNDYYLSHGLTSFAQENLNSHNQFLQSFFTNGMLGVLSVLILIIRPIYLSIRHEHVLGTLVFFPFIVYGITEVFLGRYQGVVFFALIHQLFISYYYNVASLSVKKSDI